MSAALQGLFAPERFARFYRNLFDVNRALYTSPSVPNGMTLWGVAVYRGSIKDRTSKLERMECVNHGADLQDLLAVTYIAARQGRDHEGRSCIGRDYVPFAVTDFVYTGLQEDAAEFFDRCVNSSPTLRQYCTGAYSDEVLQCSSCGASSGSRSAGPGSECVYFYDDPFPIEFHLSREFGPSCAAGIDGTSLC